MSPCRLGWLSGTEIRLGWDPPCSAETAGPSDTQDSLPRLPHGRLKEQEPKSQHLLEGPDVQLESYNPGVSKGCGRGEGGSQRTGRSSPQHKLSSFKKSFVLPLLLE